MVVRRVLGTILAGALAVASLQATPAFADAGTTRTFASGQLCTTAGEVTYNAGAITIDVGKLDPAVSEVVIAAGSLSGCIDKVTSLNWTGMHPLNKLTVQYAAFSQNNMVNTLTTVAFPSDLTSLQLDDYAFWQYASTAAGSMGPNTLSSVTFPDGLKSLSIGSAAFGQEATLGGNALASVSFPASLTSLVIDGYAFWQYAPGSNALQSVHIAGELTSLTVGEDAFYQYSSVGGNALSSVSFPSGLTSLQVGNQAFYQGASGGNPALTSVQFPADLETLNIGDQAFGQWGASGGTLETVRFPGTLTSLTIGDDAFRQQGGVSALATVILDRTESWSGAPTLTVGDNAFAGGAAPTWYWFGPDGTSLASAWNGTINGLSPAPTLVGYRELSFDTGGAGSGPGTWYVYPGGGHTTAPRVLRALLPGTWTVPELPPATRDGYTLAGWCATSASSCPSPLPVGDSYTLAAAAQTLHARWALKAPEMQSIPADARLGTSYEATVATGGELTCSVASGPLPAGLALSGCMLSGIPTAAGAFDFTITATNGAGTRSLASRVTVKNAAPTIATSTLPSGTVTVPYAATITVGGSGTITCSVTGGSLPPGLTLTGCAVTGTPTKAGSYPFTVAASNDGGSGSKTFTVVVAAAKKFTKVYKPTISGKAKVGKALKAKVKTWKPKPATISWQWYRNGVAISGATKAKYILTRADKGTKVKVTVVCTKVGYQSSSTSKSTAKVK